MKRNFALITLAFFLGVVPLGLIAAEKPNLVLLPIEVSESEQSLEDEYGSAIQKGLSLSYNVYYGSEVERELEKEYSKLDCTTESCNQNVAIAFNGELIADAAVTKFPDGYLLKLTISNVLTNRVVFSNTLPCEGCSIYSVIPILETLGVDQRTSSNAPQVVNTQSTLRRAILLLDSQPTGAIITINDEQKGRTPYQGLDYKVGDIVVVRLDSEGYIPYEDRIILTSPITQFEPITLVKAFGDVIVTVDPFIPATTILIDNEEVGIAPLNTKVQTGTHKFVARNGSDFTDVVTKSIELSNNEPVTLKFNRISGDAAPVSAVQADAESAGQMNEAGSHNMGKVVEFTNVPGYTYALINTNDGDKWFAGPSADIYTGQTVYWNEGAMLSNFNSRAVGRTFDALTFIDNYMDAPASLPSADMRDGSAGPAAGASAQQGRVLSAQTSEGYLYLEVETDNGDIWLASPAKDLREGDMIRWTDSSKMSNFTSRSLGRTFETIYFVAGIKKF